MTILWEVGKEQVGYAEIDDREKTRISYVTDLTMQLVWFLDENRMRALAFKEQSRGAPGLAFDTWDPCNQSRGTPSPLR